MPTRKSKNTEQKTPKNPIPDGQLDTAHGIPPNSGKKHTGGGQTANQESNQDKPHIINIVKIPKIDIIEGVEANKIAKTANKISRWSVSGNWLILGVTATLAIIAIKQAKSSQDAAKTAQKTYIADSTNNERVYARDSIKQIKTDSIDSVRESREQDLFKLQHEAFAETKRYDKEKFDNDTVALNLQIKALKQSNDQFVKQNEPYLKVTVDSVTIRFNQLYVFYTVSNLSNTPAMIVSVNTVADIGIYDPALRLAKGTKSNKNIYVIKETPQPNFFPIANYTDDQKKFVNTGLWSVFWDADFEYINQVTNEKRHYIISVKINKTRGDNPPFVDFKTNDNLPK
ncbi:MAG: hypothetical protein ABI308_07935 [Mucilaginibacter sp.]